MRILALKNSIYPNFDIGDVLTSENTLSAIGNSDISELVTRESVTLINPDATQLDSIIQSAPTSADRLVILSDTESTTTCNDCPVIQTLSKTSLEEAIIRLIWSALWKALGPRKYNIILFQGLNTFVGFS